MELLSSIEAIEAGSILQTARKPIRVLCNDLEFYVCKYNKGFGSADTLLREYIAASFLQVWQLPVPQFNLIQLKQEHVPGDLRLGRINFDYPCFGSLYNRNYKEVDAFLSEMSGYQKRKFTSPEDFLSIAFFDIWMSNEDRNPNNYNLLVSPEDFGYVFVPIDHECVFHTGNQQRENYTLSWEESLLSSPILTRLFKVSDFRDQTFLGELKNKWYLCCQSCKPTLTKALAGVPQEWLINTIDFENQLTNFMFSDEWFEKCWQTFLQHIQITINRS